MRHRHNRQVMLVRQADVPREGVRGATRIPRHEETPYIKLLKARIADGSHVRQDIHDHLEVSGFLTYARAIQLFGKHATKAINELNKLGITEMVPNTRSPMVRLV